MKTLTYGFYAIALSLASALLSPSLSRAEEGLDILPKRTADQVNSPFSDRFTLRGTYGLLNGEAHELVYDDFFGSRQKVSELIWDLGDLQMAGVSMGFRLMERVDIQVGFLAAVNKGSGQMVDYDWQFVGLDWSDRSISEVEVLRASIFDINGSLNLVRNPSFRLDGVLGYKVDSWKWTDSAGEYIYSSYGFRDDIGTFGGENVINYEQVFWIPYVGVRGTLFFSAVDLGAWLQFSPIVSAEDKDEHLLRNLRFKETFTGGAYLAAGVQATWRLGEQGFMGLALDMQSIPEFSGDMELFDGETGETESAAGAAGISHSSAMLSLFAGVRF